MKPLHLYLVLVILSLVRFPVCTGHISFRRKHSNRSVSLLNTNNPPSEEGRSVYDPEVYERFTGLEFDDYITEEDDDTEEDKAPHLPNYPWRGGGHIPIPLDDIRAKKRRKKRKYIIGYRDCKEVLGVRKTFDDYFKESINYNNTENYRDKLKIADDTQKNQRTGKDEDTAVSNDPDAIVNTPEGQSKSGSFAFPGVGAVHYDQDDSRGNSFFDPTQDTRILNEKLGEKEQQITGENGRDESGEDDNDALIVNETGDDSDEDGDYLFSSAYSDENDQGVGPRVTETLTADTCDVCTPCCNYLAARVEARQAAALRGRRQECREEEDEQTFLRAECRTCHVRRRMPRLGILLTCYDCTRQQADRTCRLGAYNVEVTQYRVSARYFKTTESNSTAEITGTQHPAMVELNKAIVPLIEFPGVQKSGISHVPSIPNFFADDWDLYPYELENEEENEEAEDNDNYSGRKSIKFDFDENNATNAS